MNKLSHNGCVIGRLGQYKCLAPHMVGGWVSGRCSGWELPPTAPAMKDKLTFCQLGGVMCCGEWMKVLAFEECVQV